MRKSFFVSLLLLGTLLFPPLAQAASPQLDVQPLGERLPLWSALPFVGMLLSIALGPLFFHRLWERRYAVFAAFWALALLIPFVLMYGAPAWLEVKHILLVDYVPFVILLWALFVVTGGILIEGRLRGTARLNVLLLLAGTAMASFAGTTGASMLMIRPVLRANQHRKEKAHVIVFFIFLVSNVGGALTPLGDPPLFLGFLHGVPFLWTLKLLPETLLVVAVVLGVFFVLDSRLQRHEEEVGYLPARFGPLGLKMRGKLNILFLGGILLGVLLSGVINLPGLEVAGVHLSGEGLLRDGILLSMGALSLWTTPRDIRQVNEFSWGPIREVAILFAAIFLTIIPALDMLRAGERGAMALLIQTVREPWHYFWMAGMLSSFLDNAPTYLTFFSSALGRFYPGMPEAEALPRLLAEREVYLKAIACGAVFMGANTYIGNAPNFMVRAMASSAGVKMPSFFKYMGWSSLVLIPAFILVTLVFF